MTDYKAQRGFDALVEDRTVLRDFTPYKKDVEAIVAAIVTALRSGKRIYWCGNGGSAADAVQCQQVGCGLGNQVAQQIVDAFRLLVEDQHPSPEGLDGELGGIQHRVAGGAWT